MGGAGRDPAGPLAARLEKMRQGAEAAKASPFMPEVAKEAARAGYEVALLLLARIEQLEGRNDG